LALADEKYKQNGIFKNVNTNSNYLKNLMRNILLALENNGEDSSSRKTSLSFLNDILSYNPKSLKLNVKEQGSIDRQPSF
jgi:hypothetical protein